MQKCCSRMHKLCGWEILAGVGDFAGVAGLAGITVGVVLGDFGLNGRSGWIVGGLRP